ncbi:MAG: tetratricopeptide repeat protein, partial [Bdellovibrionales bacterium]|nr:tetratricopeptide repeat protein [Bdellovibrionales bacterium]
SQGIEAKSFSESGQWQTKSCPTAKGQKWQNEDWKDLIKMANGCVVKEDWSQVEAIGNHLAKTHPLAPWGPYFLSLSAQSRKGFSRALWMIELALKKSPNNALAVYQKGRVLWAIEEYGQATEVFEHALKINPRILDAHLMLGQIFYRDQEFKKARDHFQKVVESDRSNYTALVGLAECELKSDNFEKALGYFSQAIEKNPKDLDLRVRKAFVLESTVNDPHEALKEFKEIQRLLAKGRISGQLSFDLVSKIKTLEDIVSKVALGKSEGRTPGSKEEVSK